MTGLMTGLIWSVAYGYGYAFHGSPEVPVYNILGCSVISTQSVVQ